MRLRALILSVALCGSAQAQTPLEDARAALERGDTATAAQALSLVQEGRDDQNDIDFLRGTLAFAQEDYASAIRAFREILARAPRLNRVRLELARSYFMDGQDIAAEREFRSALAAGVPPAVAQNIGTFLREIRRRRQWEFAAGAGLAADDNVNVATTSQSVDLFGLPFQLDRDARRTSGLGLNANISGAYTWMLKDDIGFKVGGAFYDAEYTKRAFTDRILDADAGPRFFVDGDTEIAVLGSATARWYGGELLNTAAGLRVEGRRPLTPRMVLEGAVSWRTQNYKPAAYSDYSGPVYSLNGVLTYALSGGGFARSVAGVVREQARFAPLRATQYIVGAGIYRENLPMGFAAYGNVRVAVVSYDAPLQAFGRTRHDTQVDWKLSVSNSHISTTRLTPVVSFIHTDRYSNIGFYSYARNRVEFGLSWSF